MICLEANLIVFSICIIPLSQVFSYSEYATVWFSTNGVKNKIDFGPPLPVCGPRTGRGGIYNLFPTQIPLPANPPCISAPVREILF